LSGLAGEGFALAVDEGEAGVAGDLDALVEQAAPALALERAAHLGALAGDECVALLAADADALAVLELEVALAADPGALAVEALDEAAVALLDAAGHVLADLFLDVAGRAVLVGALLAVPVEALAGVAARLALGAHDVVASLATDLLALAGLLLVASWAVQLEALVVH
jgi:hypothetical protein